MPLSARGVSMPGIGGVCRAFATPEKCLMGVALVACNVLTWGCGGNVDNHFPADGSIGGDSSGSPLADASSEGENPDASNRRSGDASAGRSCDAAGGRCVLGGVACANAAAPSAQDCNAPPVNPGGALCCLDLQDGDTSLIDAPSAIDAPPCRPVLPSDYDQSCTGDTDCVPVGEVSSCPDLTCDGCPTQAINKGALAQYMTAMAKAIAFAGQTSTPRFCSCPCLGFGGLCRGGKCQAAFCGPPSADTLPACADAGGICGYSANTTCNAMGPPDGCAYSDEVCCVN